MTTTSSDGEVLWQLTDYLGSVRDIVDSDGNVDNHITYDAFGNITSETSSTVDHIFGYTGRERDDESDLQFNRARYYDPAVGRWISEDPIGFAAGDTNVVRYVGNNSTNVIDPSGLLGAVSHDTVQAWGSFYNRRNWSRVGDGLFQKKEDVPQALRDFWKQMAEDDTFMLSAALMLSRQYEGFQRDQLGNAGELSGPDSGAPFRDPPDFSYVDSWFFSQGLADRLYRLFGNSLANRSDGQLVGIAVGGATAGVAAGWASFAAWGAFLARTAHPATSRALLGVLTVVSGGALGGAAGQVAET